MASRRVAHSSEYGKYSVRYEHSIADSVTVRLFEYNRSTNTMLALSILIGWVFGHFVQFASVFPDRSLFEPSNS